MWKKSCDPSVSSRKGCNSCWYLSSNFIHSMRRQSAWMGQSEGPECTICEVMVRRRRLRCNLLVRKPINGDVYTIILWLNHRTFICKVPSSRLYAFILMKIFWGSRDLYRTVNVIQSFPSIDQTPNPKIEPTQSYSPKCGLRPRRFPHLAAFSPNAGKVSRICAEEPGPTLTDGFCCLLRLVMGQQVNLPRCCLFPSGWTFWRFIKSSSEAFETTASSSIEYPRRSLPDEVLCRRQGVPNLLTPDDHSQEDWTNAASTCNIFVLRHAGNTPGR